MERKSLMLSVKVKLIIVICFIVNISFAKTPYRIIKEDSASIKINLNEKVEMIVSKYVFDNSVDAESFCRKENSFLDKQDGVLLLAASGAINEERFLNQLLVWRLENRVGIAYWSEEKDIVSIIELTPGKKPSAMSMSSASFITVFNKKMPAICSKDLE